MSGKRAFLVVLLVGLLASAGAYGQAGPPDTTWDGDSTGSWTDPLDWDNGVPGTDSNAFFVGGIGGSLTVSLGGGTGNALWVRLTSNANAYNIQNGTLALTDGGGIYSDVGVGNVNTVSASVTGANLDVTVDSGTLRLEGDNSGITSGAAEVNADGTLLLTSNDALGGANLIRLNSGSLVLEGQVSSGSPTDGLLVYHSLNGLDGGKFLNAGTLGAAADGVLNGDVSVTTGSGGVYGECAVFDGDQDFIDIGNDPGINFSTGDWTICGWASATKFGSGDENKNTLLCNGSDQGGGHRYQLVLNEQQNGKWTQVTDDNSSKHQARSEEVVGSGEWHHVVGMREGTSIKIYVDGVPVDGTATCAAGYDLSGTSMQNAFIGASHGTGDGMFKFMQGLIDEVYIYDRALSDGEITTVMNSAGLPVQYGVTALGQDIEVTGSSEIRLDGIVSVAASDLTLDDNATLTIDGEMMGFDTVEMGDNATITTNGDLAIDTLSLDLDPNITATINVNSTGTIQYLDMEDRATLAGGDLAVTYTTFYGASAAFDVADGKTISLGEVDATDGPTIAKNGLGRLAFNDATGNSYIPDGTIIAVNAGVLEARHDGVNSALDEADLELANAAAVELLGTAPGLDGDFGETDVLVKAGAAASVNTTELLLARLGNLTIEGGASLTVTNSGPLTIGDVEMYDQTALNISGDLIGGEVLIDDDDMTVTIGSDATAVFSGIAVTDGTTVAGGNVSFGATDFDGDANFAPAAGRTIALGETTAFNALIVNNGQGTLSLNDTTGTSLVEDTVFQVDAGTLEIVNKAADSGMGSDPDNEVQLNGATLRLVGIVTAEDALLVDHFLSAETADQGNGVYQHTGERRMRELPNRAVQIAGFTGEWATNWNRNAGANGSTSNCRIAEGGGTLTYDAEGLPVAEGGRVNYYKPATNNNLGRSTSLNEGDVQEYWFSALINSKTEGDDDFGEIYFNFGGQNGRFVTMGYNSSDEMRLAVRDNSSTSTATGGTWTHEVTHLIVGHVEVDYSGDEVITYYLDPTDVTTPLRLANTAAGMLTLTEDFIRDGDRITQFRLQARQGNTDPQQEADSIQFDELRIAKNYADWREGETIGYATMPGKLTVSGASVLEAPVGAMVSGGLTMLADASLSVPEPAPVQMASTTLMGNATFDTIGDVSAGSFTNDSGGAITVTKRGAGAYILDDVSGTNPPTDQTHFRVEAGVLSATMNDGNSSIGDAPVTLVGGSLKLEVISKEPVKAKAAPVEGLLTYWSFNADDATDDSGNDHDGVLYGNTTAVDGRTETGRAMQFDGTGDYIEDADAEDFLTGLEQVTISMWIKSNATGVDRGFWTCDLRDRNQDRFGGRYDSDGKESNLFKYGMTFDTSPSSNEGADNQESSEWAQTTEWQHAACTWESGVGFKLYLDGELDTPTEPMSRTVGALAQIQYFIVGDGCKNPWQGLVDEVYIYDRALDGDEIVQLRDAQGLPGGEPADFGTPIDVLGDADSGIEVTGDAGVGPVRIETGAQLTISGFGSVHLASTTIDPNGASASAVTLVVNDVGLYAGTYSDGAVDTTITMQGTGMLVFDDLENAATDANTTIVIEGGSVVLVGDTDSNPLPDTDFLIDGGSLVFASGDGENVTFDNTFEIAGTGTIEARAAAGAEVGPLTVTLTGVPDINLPPAQAFDFITDNDYSLVLDANVQGDELAVSGDVGIGGSLIANDLTVQTEASLGVGGGLDANDVVVQLDGALEVDGNATLATLTNNGGQVTVHGETVTTGNTITVNSGDVMLEQSLTAPDVVVNGGTITIVGAAVVPDITVNDGTFLAQSTVDANNVALTGNVYTQGTWAPYDTAAFTVTNSSLNLDTMILTGGTSDVSGDISAGVLSITSSVDPATGRAVGAELHARGILTVPAGQFTLASRGRLYAHNANTLSGLPDFTMSGQAELYLEAVQAATPTVTVEAGSALIGQTNGLTFRGANQPDTGETIVFHHGAIFGADPGQAEPTTTELGEIPAKGDPLQLVGAILGGAQAFKVHDDGVAGTTDDIYSELTFGRWTESPFDGQVDDVSPAQDGVVVHMNEQNHTPATTSVWNTTNSATGVDFRGTGTLTLQTGGISGTAPVITRTGDANMINNDALVMGANANPGKNIRVLNGRVELQADNSVAFMTELYLLDKATTILDGGRRPSQGTIHVEDGGMVWVDNADRLTNGAAFTWADGSILAFRCNGFDPAAAQWPTDVQFVFEREDGDDNWPSGFPVSDGAYLVGRSGGNVRFDDAGANGGPKPLATCTADDMISIAMPGGRTFWLRDPFDLRVDPDGTFGNGDEFPIHLTVGSDGPMTTVVGGNNRNRLEVAMTGEIRVQRSMVVGDIHVRSGELEINIDNSEATLDGLSHTFRCQDIYGYNLTSDIRFERCDNFNQGAPSIDGRIVWFGDMVYTDEDSDFVDALSDGTFAEEIAVGAPSRLVMRLTAGSDPKPWDPGSTCRIINQPIRILADDANWVYDYNVRTIRHESSGNNHIFFTDMTLEEGAVLRMREENSTIFTSLLLEGNATTSERDNGNEQAEDFDLYTVATDGNDYTLTIGETDQQDISQNLYGILGGGGGGRVTVDIVNGHLHVMPTAGIDANVVINDISALGDAGGLDLQKGREGLTWGDPNAVINLYDGGHLTVQVEDSNATPKVNEIDLTVHVPADNTAAVRYQLIGTDDTVSGQVRLNHILLDANAELQYLNADGVDLIASGEVAGDARLMNPDSAGDAFVGDFTGDHALTLTGGRPLGSGELTDIIVLGTIDTHTLIFDTAADMEGFSVSLAAGAALDCNTIVFSAPVVFDPAATADANHVFFNVPMLLDPNVDIDMDNAYVNSQVTLDGVTAGEVHWELNPGGELVSMGLAAVAGGDIVFKGGTLGLREDGNQTVDLPMTIAGVDAGLSIGKRTPAGPNECTFSFGQIVLTGTGPRLRLTSLDGYDYAFAGVNVDTAAGEILIETPETDANLGPVVFSRDGELNLDAAAGSISTMTLGPLDANGFNAAINFGVNDLGGNLRLTSSTNWGNNPVNIVGSWLIVDDTPVTGIPNIDASQGGIDVRTNGQDLSTWTVKSLKLSDTMAGATAPTAPITGKLVINAPEIDAGFRRSDTTPLVVQSVGEAASIYSQVADSNVQAPIEIVGDVQLGLAGGGGQSFRLGGALSGNGSIDKVGQETVTLGAANPYAGDTVVSTGKLVVQDAAGLGVGETSIAADATLELDVGTGEQLDHASPLQNLGTLHLKSGTADLGSTVIVGQAPESVRPTNGLVAHYAFEDQAGATATDSGPNGLHATLRGASWTAQGRVGGAVEFTGDGDDILRTGDPNQYLDGLSEITVAMWIKSDVVDTDRGFLFFNDPAGSDNYGWRYDEAGGDTGRDQVVKGGVNTTTGRHELESGELIQTTDWQHFTVTWKSGQAEQYYFNGVADPCMATTGGNAAIRTGTLTGYDRIMIGRGGKDTDASNQSWDGLIDDVRIYDHALSAEELGQLFWKGSEIIVDAAATMRLGGFTGAGTVTVNGTMIFQSTDSDCVELEIGPDGLLDVNDATILVTNGDFATLLAEVMEGYNDGGWDGATGITSSLATQEDYAVGIWEDADGVKVGLALMGDVTMDGIVDYFDYEVLKANYGATNANWALGDYDYNQVVDWRDYVTLKKYWGVGAPPAGEIPEPATMALLALGAGAALLRRRRR